MENKIGKSFDSLAQRVVYSFAGTFPEFVPIKSTEVSEQSQLDMYGFLKDITIRLYENPAILSLPIQEDESYGDWELRKCKPKLAIAMKYCLNKINEFYLLLIEIGKFGIIEGDTLHVNKQHLKLTPNMLTKLEWFGLSGINGKDEVIFRCEEHHGLFAGWKLLVKVSDVQKNPVIFFSRCMFDSEYSYPGDIFESLVEEKHAFKDLQDFFKQNGYKRVDCRDDQVSLDWAKNYGRKDEPLKASWAEREHGGISIWFDYSKKNQVFIGLRVPEYRELLKQFDLMDDRQKAFVISKTKKCDGCGYCTQTDRTGSHKPQFVSVVYNGEHNLCMLFPGFTYIWTRINDIAASNIISFLSWMDRILCRREQI
jgi:hypothetical protein